MEIMDIAQGVTAFATFVNGVVVFIQLCRYNEKQRQEEHRILTETVLELMQLLEYQKNFITRKLTSIWIRYFFSCYYDELKDKLTVSEEASDKLKYFRTCIHSKKRKYIYPSDYIAFENKNHILNIYADTRLYSYKDIKEKIVNYNNLEKTFKEDIEKEIKKWIIDKTNELNSIIEINTNVSDERIDYESIFQQIENTISPWVRNKKLKLESVCDEIQSTLYKKLISEYHNKKRFQTK